MMNIPLVPNPTCLYWTSLLRHLLSVCLMLEPKYHDQVGSARLLAPYLGRRVGSLSLLLAPGCIRFELLFFCLFLLFFA